jgi:flagellar FliL protein
MKRIVPLCFFGVWLTWLITAPTFAEDSEAPVAQAQYIELAPSFVLNFGEAGAKLRYLKADIVLRVDSPSAATAVENHMPALRNELILFLSRQSDETMMDNSKREELRLEALKHLQEVVKKEEGSDSIVDLLFTNFVVQR